MEILGHSAGIYFNGVLPGHFFREGALHRDMPVLSRLAAAALLLVTTLC